MAERSGTGKKGESVSDRRFKRWWWWQKKIIICHAEFISASKILDKRRF